MHALSRAVRISSEIGIFAVRVLKDTASHHIDAMDLEAKNFYLKYGFIPLQDTEFSLILPLKTIVASRN